EELTRGLVFLQPPSRSGLEEALTHPLEMAGYSFESGVVHAMLEALEATSGSLPLLQFTAAKLWDTRDRQRRVLTRDSYLQIGGVAGALATHADEVLASLPAPDQKLARAVFQRLVTPERTRAIVDSTELRDIGPDIDRIITHLVGARLLVVQTRGEGAGAVELVHESLIKSWPTLQRWLDENQEDAAYLGQIRAASKQWELKGRPEGLLWRAEAMEELRLWRARYQGQLPDREWAFVEAVLELGTRAARARRRVVVGAFVFLLALVAAAGVALVVIFQAKQEAAEQRNEALAAQKTADEKAAEALAAKQTIKDQYDNLVEEKRKTQEAKDKELAATLKAQQEALAKNAEAARANTEAAHAELARAKAEQAKAMAIAEKAKAKAAAEQAKTAQEHANKNAASAAPTEERKKKITSTLKR
ncbi:MAG TPA: AAA family ATPase, partial [Kofleriaceae bacterium]|nr:AAA family ATPase [Kofleriaceae bacterium]